MRKVGFIVKQEDQIGELYEWTERELNLKGLVGQKRYAWH